MIVRCNLPVQNEECQIHDEVLLEVFCFQMFSQVVIFMMTVVAVVVVAVSVACSDQITGGMRKIAPPPTLCSCYPLTFS